MAVAGCGRRVPTPLGPPVEAPVPVYEELPPAPGPALLWIPSPSLDPLAAARFLEARPRLRVTVVFPDRFFGEDENAQAARAVFARLVSQKQVEPVLTLPGRPVLALLHDSDFARLSTTTASSALPPRFAWPDDASGQAALARSRHRRRWRADPAGLSLPWGAALGPEIEPLVRLKLKWLLAPGPGEPGCFRGLALPLVRAAVPAGTAAARAEWLRTRLAGGDASALRAPLQAASLDELAAADAAAGPEAKWMTVTDWLDDGETCADLPVDRAPPDFAPWIGEPEENTAWQLLGQARQSLEAFKNSGRADVRGLDLATRELYGAESGDYFYYFGADQKSARDPDLKREFLATLAQVYRIMGQSVPPALQQGFSGAPPAAEGGTVEREFFRRAGNVLIWRDAAKDDRGPGDYFYPTGTGFPSGSWDLRSFRVESREAEVGFQFELAALANPGGGPYGFSLPLLEVYVDINRLPGAGSESLLPGRPGVVESQNAWEYALSVDGWGARLYQYSPGGSPRRVATFPARVVGPGAVRVDVPRRHLRGDPDGWGYAVAVLGRAAGTEPAPMRVLAEPGPEHFGGAAAETGPRGAPPYLDLLTPEGLSQEDALGVYKQGREVALPFVRVE